MISFKLTVSHPKQLYSYLVEICMREFSCGKFIKHVKCEHRSQFEFSGVFFILKCSMTEFSESKKDENFSDSSECLAGYLKADSSLTALG
jgi:hypothetical protein